MGVVRDLYMARKIGAGLKLPAPTVVSLIKRLLLSKIYSDEKKTETGVLIHILNALAEPAIAAVASITPTQNLNGYTKPWPAGGGKNLLDSATVFADTARYTVNADESVTMLQTNGQSWASTTVVGIPLEAGTYTFSRSNASGSVQIRQSSNNYTENILSLSNEVSSGSFTLTSADTIKIKPNTGSTAVYPNTSFFQLELGSTATDWTPYENICPISGSTGLSVYVSPTQDLADATTYTEDWTSQAGAVYGGMVDVVTGVLTVDMVNIPSYNGETINEPWLSSMDEYTPGATPTTGAQVVYKLATPLTYQLTPQEVQMLLGENYVWSSTGGNVSVTYLADGNATPLESLNLMLGNRYSNPGTVEDVSDREALEILLGR